MGLFHCPLGAVGFGDEGCIRCGLCSAATAERKKAAAEILRAWIREHGSSRKDIKIQKIAICGKGGAGKSTATALLSGALAALGYRSLIIDTDNSNGGLWRKLGLSAPPLPLRSGDEPPRFLTKDPLYLSDIDESYIAVNGMRSMVLPGKIDDPLLGCACSIAAFAKTLIDNIALSQNELVIADQEAGVESFGRGVEQGCDTVLILTEPSLESIELAEKIQYMAQGIGIQRIRALINKAEDQDQVEFMQESLSARSIRCLGNLPLKKDILNRNLRGAELTPEFSYRIAGQIARYLLDEAEMSYTKPILTTTQGDK